MQEFIVKSSRKKATVFYGLITISGQNILMFVLLLTALLIEFAIPESEGFLLLACDAIWFALMFVLILSIKRPKKT